MELSLNSSKHDVRNLEYVLLRKREMPPSWHGFLRLTCLFGGCTAITTPLRSTPLVVFNTESRLESRIMSRDARCTFNPAPAPVALVLLPSSSSSSPSLSGVALTRRAAVVTLISCRVHQPTNVNKAFEEIDFSAFGKGDPYRAANACACVMM